MRLSRRSARWLLPIAVASSAAVAAGLPSLLPAGADPVPVLPELTAAELVAKVQAADVTAFSGTLSFQANLGLPDLSGMLRTGSAPSTVLDLLAGTHTAKVSIDGAEHQRIALDGPQSETDWIHNGTDLWSWNSTTNAVMHATVPADHGDHHDQADEPSGRAEDPARPDVLPGDMTAVLLDTVGRSTDISVRTPGYVADRPVYELVLAPKAAASTVADIVVDVDASTGMPLQIKVEAKDSTKPVLQLGFTAISYDQPPASVFAFTPPPGATVTEASSPAELVPFGHSGERRHGGRGRDGADATTPAAPSTDRSVPAVPGGMNGMNGMNGLNGMGLGGGNTSMVEVGSDWSTMAVVSGLNLPAQYAMLLGEGTEVSTPSGPARLIHTRLINILLLDDGRLAIAALDPAAMAAAIPAA